MNKRVSTIATIVVVSFVLLTAAASVSRACSIMPEARTASPFMNLSLPPASGTSDVLQSAYGGGTAVEFERRSTFTFNAFKHVDGSVTGTMVYMFRDFGLDYKVQLKIDCLTIEGNRAKVSGLVTKISANIPLPPWAQVGSRSSFQVEDNGDGDQGLPDRYSDLHGFEATCNDDNDPYIPIDGNIVVYP